MSETNEKKKQWTDRFQEVLQVCQTEIKRTTEIGKRMISAGQSNAQMSEVYQKLGELAYHQIKEKKLDWQDHKVEDYIIQIDELKSALENLEEDVQSIKKEASSPSMK